MAHPREDEQFHAPSALLKSHGAEGLLLKQGVQQLERLNT
jgi:hypothetical protein